MTKKKAAKKRGRPETYTKKLGEYVCEELCKGRSLKNICDTHKTLDEATVRGWAYRDVDGFAERFFRARDIGLDCMADAVIDIADGEGDPQRDRLRVDTRKWYLSKLAPKRYSDKHQVDHTSSDGSMTPKPTTIKVVGGKPDAD